MVEDGPDECSKIQYMSEEEIQSAQTTTQAAMGISFATSLLNFSSPQGMYAMLGIYRMLILIPFVGAQISQDFISYLTGLNFVMGSFSFIPVEKAPVLGDIIDFLTLNSKIPS